MKDEIAGDKQPKMLVFLDRLKSVTGRIGEDTNAIEGKVNLIDFNPEKSAGEAIAKGRDINCVLDELNELVDRLESYENRLSITYNKLGRII